MESEGTWEPGYLSCTVSTGRPSCSPGVMARAARLPAFRHQPRASAGSWRPQQGSPGPGGRVGSREGQQGNEDFAVRLGVGPGLAREAVGQCRDKGSVFFGKRREDRPLQHRFKTEKAQAAASQDGTPSSLRSHHTCPRCSGTGRRSRVSRSRLPTAAPPAGTAGHSEGSSSAASFPTSQEGV